MAKRPTLIDITAGYGSNTQHNANNDEIETAFDNTLSRDGSSPNSMEADLDMNGNDLLNVGSVNGGGLEAAVSRGLIEEYLVDTKVQLESASIGTGVKFVRTNGYTTQGDGGGASYQKVDNEPSHTWKVQSGDGAWWELVPDPMGINVKQLGAVGDDTTDDFTAFDNAVNNGPDLNVAGNNAAHHTVIVPGSTLAYHLGSTLQLKKAVHILGPGSGLDNSPKAAKLRWPANTTGIIVHASNTIDAAVESPSTSSGGGSIVEGLELWSDGGTIAGVTDDTKGNGIWLRARAMLRHLRINTWPGDGIHIEATSGGADGPQAEGNANGWHVDSVRIAACNLNGVYVRGADSNAGLGQAIDVTNCGRAAIRDDSFLGNTYIGCQAEACGVAGVAANAANEASYVDFGGTRYIANRTATEAELVATQPGTDPTVWIDVGAGSGSVTWQASEPEGTYFVGGAYVCGTGSTLVGMYHEEGQAYSQVAGVIVGSQHQRNYDSAGISMTFSELSGKFDWSNDRTYPDRTVDRKLTLGFWETDENRPIRLVADGDSGLGLSLMAWDENGGRFNFIHGNTSWMYVTSDLTTTTYGRASGFDAAHPVFENGIVVGSGGGARHMTNATAAPTTGEHARGEIVWNQEPSAGGKAGWICVSGGTPGTWKQFGAIDA